MRTIRTALLALTMLALAGCDPSPGDAGDATEVLHAAVTLPPMQPAGGEGTLLLAPSTPRLAGEPTSYEFNFTVGASGLGAGGGLLLIDPLFHGVSMIKYADWTTDPAECNDDYIEGGQDTARYEGLIWAEVDVAGVDVEVLRPEHTADMHQPMYTQFTVSDAVPAGATLTIWLGTDQETPLGPADPLCLGRAPYRAFRHVEWTAASRADELADWAVLDAPAPTVRIHSAPQLAETRVLLPSFAQVGETIDVHVVFLDAYGNPLEAFDGTFVTQPSLPVDDLDHAVEFDHHAEGLLLLAATPQDEGVLRIEVHGGHGIDGTSNPCVVTADPPRHQLLWGDIHSHHGASHRTPLGMLIDENLEYARDVAVLDFAGESMKLPPLEVEGQALWEELKLSCTGYEDGAFVPMLGFEWMGPGGAGHHNVYFDSCWGEITDSPQLTGLDSPEGLWPFLDEVLAANPGVDAITVPHASKYTGFGWDAQHDGYRTVAEVTSEWGESIVADGLSSVPDGLLAGNTMGFIAASDNHDGYMGNPLAFKNDVGGLTGVLVAEHSRDAIFTALQQRTTLATSRERMIALLWTEEEGYRSIQGERLVGFEPTFEIEIHGTAPLESAALHRVDLDGGDGDEVIAEWTFGGELDARLALAPGDDGYDVDGEAAYYLHADEQGEGAAWTSPVFVVPDCDGDADDPAGLCAAADDDDTTDDDDSADDDSTGDDDTSGDDDSAVGDDDDCACRADGGPPAGGGAALALLLAALGWRRRR